MKIGRRDNIRDMYRKEGDVWQTPPNTVSPREYLGCATEEDIRFLTKKVLIKGGLVNKAKEKKAVRKN